MPVIQGKPPVTTEWAHISSRFTGLDTLRGFTLISMILYHICYNLVYIFHIPLPWYHTIGAHLWQLSICCTFLLLAGVCTHFTRRPVQRALRIGAAALAVTIVTYIFMPRELIVFGILHCMTWCLFSYAALEKLLRRVPPKFGLICSVISAICNPAATAMVFVLLAIDFWFYFTRFLFRRLFSHIPIHIFVFCRAFSWISAVPASKRHQRFFNSPTGIFRTA